MLPEPAIYKALRQQVLWPSVHAAVDVYRRRRECAGDPYELTWRLIHISECVVITLASAAVARIRDIPSLRSEYLKLRERCHGLSWNETEEVLERVQGALDGSVDKWIEILQLISASDPSGSDFLQALQTFLNGSATTETTGEFPKIDLAPLIRAWSQACDIPAGVKSEALPPKEALKAFNSFRNRFAHVPFPYDRVNEVWLALEECTFRIFDMKPPACNVLSPLSGAFGQGSSILCGSGFCKPEDSWQATDGDVYYCWGNAHREVWKARPFVHIDKMMRPYVLTRLRNEEGEWEYIRYLAEANAVLRVNEPAWIKVLCPPEKADYVIPEDKAAATTKAAELSVPATTSVPAPPAPQTRADALAAVREKQYEPAISFFRKEVEARPQYHSGWSRLGYAQREYAAHLMDSGNDLRAAEVLKQAIESFGHGVQHEETRYSAEAYYHRSKAYWRLWRINRSAEDLDNAIEDANRAAKDYYEDRFVRWVEYLQEENGRIDGPK